MFRRLVLWKLEVREERILDLGPSSYGLLYGEAVRSTGSAALFKGGDILEIRLCVRARTRQVLEDSADSADSVAVQAEGAFP
jgi:hypothetical protein